MSFALLRSLAAGLLLAVAQQLVSAAPSSADLSEPDKIRLAQLLERKTGLKVASIGASPFPGLYEVIVGTSVYYADADGKWLFDGHVIDLDTKSSVTAQKRIALERGTSPALDWRTLRLTDAIKTVRGTPIPGRVLITFEDPSCGFCKKLNKELDRVANVVVYTFPIDILGSSSRTKNEAVWCSADRTSAWAATVNGARPTAGRTCNLDALDRNSQLAKSLSVTGTPTLFLADGSRIPGFIDAAAIEARLQAQQK